MFFMRRRSNWFMCVTIGLAMAGAPGVWAQSETDFYDNAVGLMGQKKVAEAESEFRKSIQTDPRYKEAWEGLAGALQAQGKDASAVLKMADAAPAARAGAAPALSDEQKSALAGTGVAQPVAPAPVAAAPVVPAPAPPAAADAPAAVPAPVVDPAPAPVAAIPVVNLPDRPIDQSEIVGKGPDGAPAVIQKDGHPVDGVKLSTHDADIITPQIGTTTDGTIHVTFVERQEISPYAYFVYHRQSTDGGKTFTDAKNLSEDMAGIPVGNCIQVVDSQDRVYVIWRTALKEMFPVLQTPAGNGQHNLVYRVLDHGKWSKILRVHPPGSVETQDDGSVSFTAVVDAGGRAQVFYNTLPDRFDPEKYMVVSPGYQQHVNTISRGLLWEATLDGAKAPTPKQVYLANFKVKPEDPKYGRSCDDLDGLDGYADANGSPHLIAKIRNEEYDKNSAQTHVELIEDNKQTPAVILPQVYTFDSSPPKLLVDAAGKRHVIALYAAGEHPAVKDYTLGSDEDPVVIRATQGQKGTLVGFQAAQGPGGRMAVVMQFRDKGTFECGDTYLSTSTNGEWSTPVCVTNNSGRSTFWSKNTGVLSGASAGSEFDCAPAGAVTWDRDGHLLLALINVERGSFGLSAGGVVYSSGSTSTPRLNFYKF